MATKIFPNVNDFMKEHGNHLHKVNAELVVTSGGFDPMHIGHLRCIQATSRIAEQEGGVTVVIVNSDGFLIRKKGKPFMPHSERMEIIAGIKGVDFVVGWDDGTQTVTGCLEILMPNIFTKGGDRSDSAKVPEFVFCDSIGCDVVFGVGGSDKVQSSSDLISEGLHKDDIVEEKRHRSTDFDWGYEEKIANNEFYDAKILSIRPNHTIPLQSHSKKDKTLCALDGVINLRIYEGESSAFVFLDTGDFKRIKAGTTYRISSWSGPAKIFEVSVYKPGDSVINKK